MKNLRFIFLASLAVLLWSAYGCKPDPIEIDMPAHEPKLVIASQVIADNILFVSISKSFSALAGSGDTLSQDSAFVAGLLVEHALVKVTVGGRDIILHPIERGIYFTDQLNLIPQGYCSIYVKDSVSGLECLASAQMLPAVRFDSIKPFIDKKPGDTTVYIDYSFTDRPNEENYYMLTLSFPNQDSAVVSKTSFLSLKQNQQNFFLFTDKDFENGRMSERQKLLVNAHEYIAFGLSNITREYYNYLQAYQRSYKTFNQLTGEPVNMPTNIQHGYGYFSVHNPDVALFDLNEW